MANVPSTAPTRKSASLRRSAGEENVEIMKQLALKGKGLGTFIYRHVAYRYEK